MNEPKKLYKVWLHMEEIDPEDLDSDPRNMDDEVMPIQAFASESQQEAEDFMNDINLQYYRGI